MTDQMQVDINEVLAEMQATVGALIQENAVLKTVNRKLTAQLAEKQDATN